MQINRLFEIVYLLIDKKRLTAKELSERLEVSTRTILRDIETLSAAGIPIYTVQGKGGGISILDQFILNKAMLSDDEQAQVLFALQSLSSSNQVDVHSILAKLTSLFDKIGESWIEVDFSHWTNRKPDTQRFETLKAAILRKQAIAFTYLNPSGDSSHRTTYPLKLIFKAKSWYLQGYCLVKQDYRTFKINRMQQIEITSESYADQQFHLPPLELPTNTEDSLIHIKLWFAPQVAYRVYDEVDQKDITQNEDGSLLVSIRVPEDDWLYGFLLSYGTAVHIVEPQYIKETLLQKLEEIKRLLI